MYILQLFDLKEISSFIHTSSHTSHDRKRKAIVRQWDAEWGELATEVNIWWLGSSRANWEYRMGKNWVGWFCKYFFSSPVFPPTTLHDQIVFVAIDGVVISLIFTVANLILCVRF